MAAQLSQFALPRFQILAQDVTLAAQLSQFALPRLQILAQALALCSRLSELALELADGPQGLHCLVFPRPEFSFQCLPVLAEICDRGVQIIAKWRALA